MPVNRDIKRTCKGFGTEYACGNCIILMHTCDLDFMSLVQVTDLLMDITRKISISELPVITTFSDCTTSCRPGDVRCLGNRYPYASLDQYINLVISTMSNWRSAAFQSQPEKLNGKYIHDVSTRAFYNDRLCGVKDIDSLIWCLKDMNECASGRTTTLTSEYAHIAMTTF